jgi:crotonobetainyl-CoA:carnitine CoA-transferase CaiB-like acyl-CoA transferase
MSEPSGEGAATSMLEGVRVLDFTQVLAGPTVTRLMCEFGADVIKVEPPRGEVARQLPWIRDGRSGYFIQQNRGKRSLCVDVKSDEGRELLERLIPQVDVVTENFRPGVIERLGFGYERLRELNPKIILCSVSALGQEGELATKPGYDTVGAAYAGFAFMTGSLESGPSMPTPAFGDSSTGICGFGAVAMALFNRERTGRGAWVQAALVDTYIQGHELNVQMIAGSRGEYHPAPVGPYNSSVVPSGIFPSAGRYIFVACVSEAEWRRLCGAMGKPEMAEEERFVTNAARSAHFEECIEEVVSWLDGFESVQDAAAALEAADVACAPILDVEEALAHPHNRSRGAVRTVTDPVWGEIDLPGVPIRVHEMDFDPGLIAPELGAHNAEVLEGLLGIGADEVERLHADGVIGPS